MYTEFVAMFCQNAAMSSVYSYHNISPTRKHNICFGKLHVCSYSSCMVESLLDFIIVMISVDGADYMMETFGQKLIIKQVAMLDYVTGFAKRGSSHTHLIYQF